ncbi:hypothetical protein C8R47DRAFT_1316743 [Mycena vitilis]|nr:hypothetical protein C8R47DRAFT_1316743 [Mycena vitilis]
MKLILSTFIALSMVASPALAVPTDSSVLSNVFEKRSAKCRITGSGARCRRSASATADIIGTFSLGATPTFTCTTSGSTVGGTDLWDRTHITVGGSSVACYVSNSLVASPCPEAVPEC